MFLVSLIAMFAGSTSDQIQKKIDEQLAKMAKLEERGVNSGPQWAAIEEELSLQRERLEIVKRRESRHPMR